MSLYSVSVPVERLRAMEQELDIEKKKNKELLRLKDLSEELSRENDLLKQRMATLLGDNKHLISTNKEFCTNNNTLHVKIIQLKHILRDLFNTNKKLYEDVGDAYEKSLDIYL